MTGEKPTYVDPGGFEGGVPNAPPFVFQKVNARMFPIKANMARLGLFIHQYLNNDIPPEIAHFRPALPYVYLGLLNYGKLAPATVEAQNIGWVSQHEIIFTVPLEWWSGGKFKDWAFVTPFIFVDNEVSLTTGREVYGWPKIKAVIQEEAPLWTVDPRSRTRLLNLKTKLFPKLFEGEREENRELLQIYRDPPPCFSQFPPDPSNPWFPLSALQAAASGWMDVMGNSLEIITGLPLRGYRGGRDPSTLVSMFWKAGKRASLLLPDLLRQAPHRSKTTLPVDPEPPELRLKQITLKQFHHPEKPREACYQAIVGSDIGVDSVSRIGLLGDENLLRGDPSGGFTIRIYRYDAQPIVECLGLEEVREEEGEYAPVSILKPTFPFWTDTDLYYGKGEVICSRPKVLDNDKVICSPKVLDDDKFSPSWEPNMKRGEQVAKDMDSCKILYNTVRGGATQPIVGPFDFPDVTVQLYALEATKNRLEEFLDDYLNVPLKTLADPWKITFEPWGSHVYLMVTIYDDKGGKMSSDNNNIGWWVEKEVSVCVPVIWKRKQVRDPKSNFAIVCPYSFGHTGRAVISDREINGRPTVKANIESCLDVWLDPSGPAAQRKLLKLDTEIYPGLYLGQRAVDRTLIEIVEAPKQDRGSNGKTNSRSRTEKVEIAKTKEEITKKLGAEPLKKSLTIDWFHLKQHRDAQDTRKLCYQALVKTRRTLNHNPEIGVIKSLDKDVGLNIHIHKYPGRPIAHLLGLKNKKKDDSSGKSKVEIFPAVDPFWMRIAVEEELGKVVCYRTNSQSWVVNKKSLLSN